MHNQMMEKQRGMTLVELLVTIAIVAILASLAAPSFVQMVANNAIAGQLNSFYVDARFARSEAVKRGADVGMCPSDNPLDAEPVCKTSDSDWKSGWIVFVDSNSNGSRSNVAANGEIILRRQEAYTNSQSIVGTSAVSSIRYNGDGRVAGGAANLVFSAIGDVVDSRKICISMTGKVRILDKGLTSCT